MALQRSSDNQISDGVETKLRKTGQSQMPTATNPSALTRQVIDSVHNSAEVKGSFGNFAE